MKNLAQLVLVSALMAIATVASADTNVNRSALTQKVTVKQALTLKDDSNLELKGYVVKALGDEKYQFRDSTGTINVEIDDELWQGKPVPAKTPVTIVGEIDIDYNPTKRIEIDVDSVRF